MCSSDTVYLIFGIFALARVPIKLTGIIFTGNIRAFWL